MSSRQSNASPWYDDWHCHLQEQGPRMSDDQMLASARLATVLLCGEQSAIQIFSTEVKRLGETNFRKVRDCLLVIEQEEKLHEHALSSFARYLPRADDQHALKRHAQRFFASLGRTRDYARHFGQISHLDSAVCKIMWHVEKCALPSVSPLRLLAQRIKNDEARHVAVSRRYASELGLQDSTRRADSEVLRLQLVGMLECLAPSFEAVGVDSDRLFRHISANSST